MKPSPRSSLLGKNVSPPAKVATTTAAGRGKNAIKFHCHHLRLTLLHTYSHISTAHTYCVCKYKQMYCLLSNE